MRLSVLSELDVWQNSRCVIYVRHYVHCAKGKKEQRQFIYFYELQELKQVATDYLLIFRNSTRLLNNFSG